MTWETFIDSDWQYLLLLLQALQVYCVAGAASIWCIAVLRSVHLYARNGTWNVNTNTVGGSGWLMYLLTVQLSVQ